MDPMIGKLDGSEAQLGYMLRGLGAEPPPVLIV